MSKYTFLLTQSRKLTIVIQLVMLGFALQAQTITGKIVDGEGQAVVGAHIIALHSSVATISDWDGRFQIQLSSPTDSLEITAMSFQK